MRNSTGNMQVSLRNCWIKNSAATGIYVQKSSYQYNADIKTVNHFEDTIAANVYFYIK